MSKLHEALNTWNTRRSAELYCIDAWSNDYKHARSDGNRNYCYNSSSAEPKLIRLLQQSFLSGWWRWVRHGL